jgi:DNA (cytosine-5)-methyltransferase 1
MTLPTVLELFAGIGGLSLGLERAGFGVVGQVELDPFCRSVLAAHWPEVPRHADARTAADWWQSEPRPAVDLVAGGFPCQPFSIAGLKRGIADPRWMWPAMACVIRLLRPRYVLVENVPALLGDRTAFGWLLSDLADLGFNAEWSLLSACAVGAPHVRKRLFLVAYPNSIDGPPRMGPDLAGGREAIERRRSAARAWRDQVTRSVEASRTDDRDLDGAAARMVAAGGNAVVPAVAEQVGRMILAHIAGTTAERPREAA